MPTTIVTTTGSGNPSGFNTQRHLDRCRNGVWWFMAQTASQLRFYRSTDNGATWTETSGARISNIKTSAGASMRIAARADGVERIAVIYVTSDDDRVKTAMGKFNGSRTVITWQQTDKLTSKTGPSSFWLHPDIELDPRADNWVCPVAWGRLVDGRAMMYMSRVRWQESGTGYAITESVVDSGPSTIFPAPSLALRHLGDDNLVDQANNDLYVTWNRVAAGDLFMMRNTAEGLDWQTGTKRIVQDPGPNGTRVASAYSGERMVTVSTKTDATAELVMHVMLPSDSTPPTSIDVPDLLDGVITNVGVSWDTYSGDIIIVASGDTSDNLSYIRYRWPIRQWDDDGWINVVTTEDVVADTLSVQPGSKKSAVGAVYAIVSGSDRAVRYQQVVTTNALPSSPPWVTTPGAKNRSLALLLDWVHADSDDDPQAAYTLRRTRVIAGVTTIDYWNGSSFQSTQIDLSSATTEVTLSSGWAADGEIVSYAVRTSDGQGFGPWSAELTVIGSTLVTPTITAPSGTVTTPTVTLTWNVPAEQQAYRVRVLDLTNVELADFGWVGQPSTRSLDVPFDFEDGASYRLELRIQNVHGLESGAVTTDINMSLTPPPLPVTILTVPGVDGTIVVDVDNGTAGGGEAAAAENDIYRRDITAGESVYTLVAQAIAADTAWTDYTVADGHEYGYFHRARTGVGAVRDGVEATATANLFDVYVHVDGVPEEFLAFGNCEGLVESTAGPATVGLYSAGNTRRRVGRGYLTTYKLDFTACTRAQKTFLRSHVETMLLVRDPRGNLARGGYDNKTISITEYPAVDRSDISISFTAVSDAADLE